MVNIKRALLPLFVVFLISIVACDSSGDEFADDPKTGQLPEDRDDAEQNPSNPTDSNQSTGTDSESDGLSIQQDPSTKGVFQFASFEANLASTAYSSARVYYPLPTEDFPGPFPATTMSGGFSNTKEDMTWLSERIASHGIIVIAFTPTNNLTTDPTPWVNGHIGSIDKILEETERSESPVFEMVDTDKLGIAGYSMGGAGTIIAANTLGDMIKVAAPFNAFQPVNATMSAATIFLTGSADNVAIPSNVYSSYQSLSGTNKALVNLNGSTHFMMLTPSVAESQMISTYVLSWYHYHLDEQSGYAKYLTGKENEADLQNGVFAANGYLIELD